MKAMKSEGDLALLHERVDKLLHEPRRLAIMATLCSRPEEFAFSELQKACGLTEGNLSAHLKALAALPSADVLKGMLLGALVGVPKKFLGVLQAPARDFVGVLAARERQLAEQAA